MTEIETTAIEKLEKWLFNNHPDILIECKELVEEGEQLDLMDACDEVDSHVYYYYCEYVPD